MEDLSEAGKRVFFVVLLVTIIAIFVFMNFSNTDVSLNDVEMNTSDLENLVENLDLEEIENISLGENVSMKNILSLEDIKPDYVQKKSIRNKLSEVYFEDGEIYFVVEGTDLYLNEEDSKASGNYYLRSPIMWSAYLMLHGNERLQLFVCEFSSEENIWNAKYCLSSSELSDGFFEQTTRVIYTDLNFAEMNDINPIDLSKDDRTYVFEIILPEEFK